MIELVIGGASSGKSEYAEKRCVEIAAGKPLVYLATMISGDSESDRRIRIHQDRREGMGFNTIEKPFDICKVDLLLPGATVLVECVTNLVANEMFAREDSKNFCCEPKETGEKIYKDFLDLYDLENVKNLVIVTGNLFEDGIEYDDMTSKYLECLAYINNRLAAKADNLTEVVCKIPLKH